SFERATADPIDTATATILDRGDPIFTDEMKRRNGSVFLECVMDVCGQVKSCAVTRSAGEPFTSAGVTAGQKWRSRAAEGEGRRVPFRYGVRIDFRKK